MKRPFLLACSMVFLAAAAGRADAGEHHAPSAVQAFNKGVHEFNANHFEEAIPLFDQAISHDDQFADAYYARAACRHELKQNDMAFSDVNLAIQSKPDYADAYALRGVLNYESNQLDDAYRDFTSAIKLNPADAQSLFGRGVVALKQDKLQTAQHDFRAFLRLRPHDPMAPKLRSVLASLSQDSHRAAAAGSEEESNEAPASASAQRSTHVSQKTQELASDLFLNSHELSDSYNQKAMHGESSNAVGDINAMHGAPTKEKSGGDDIQIVEPN